MLRLRVYVYVGDTVDAHHDRAVAAGAEVVMPLTDTDYGSREYLVRDLEGHLSSFGSYAPKLD
ncbi:VOC family protein [Micromonospora craniellae]|uniref:VOC family protein n=1 Tax=Micromonospora craniellae TaxID=2294034 RepID=UPI0037C5243A